MKKSIILVTSLLFIAGCGAFNKKDLNDARFLRDDQRVDFNNANGIYDLADYLFPKKNHIYQYEITTESKENQDISDPYTIDREYEYTIDGQSITINDATYTIFDLNISEVQRYNNFKKIRTFRRHLDINDTFDSFETVSIEKNYSNTGMLLCQLEEHLEEMELFNNKYTDVIHLFCEGDFLKKSIDFRERREFGIDYFYAKNVGRIAEVLNEKETNIYGNTQYLIESNKTTILKTILQ